VENRSQQLEERQLMQRAEDRSGLFAGKPFARIYHYHIRKTGGTSLNWAFFRLSGQDPKELYARINEEGLVKAGGIRYVGWQRPLIASGNWDYGFAHAAFHNVSVPADTYKFCVLRDPAARVLSHYKMLLHMRDHEPNHSGYIREASWVEAGFDGFLERISRQELQRQVFMFSRSFDVGEALENLDRVSRVMLLDDRFAEDVSGLCDDTGLALEYVHERAAKVDFQPTEDQRDRLLELLEPEYRLIEVMKKRIRPSAANEHETHEFVTMSDNPRNEHVSADPVKKAYQDLWKQKLNDEEWLKNDGRGRVEYAANILRPALRPEHRILDIGCGRGTLGIILQRRQGMFGVDLAPEAIEKAKELYEDARVVNIDAEPLPWPDNSFEYVVYLDVIEHVFDPRIGLREIQRVLKPGGKLLLSTPNILAHIDKMRETRRFPKTSGDPEPYDGGHLHFFTYQDIYDLLKLTGFAQSESASPRGNDPDFEFNDKMVWVVGTKVADKPLKRVASDKTVNVSDKLAVSTPPASPATKTVNVNTRKRFSVPVAVVAYNRPDHTRQVLDALRDYGVDKLYLFADATKKPEHQESVGQVRELLRSVNWTDTELIERETNFGLAKSIVGAANHVFAHNDRMLLFEDDIVPFPSLFPFLENALDKYADDPRVTGISGYGVPQPEAVKQRYPYDAWFFPRISSWGWATWKRVWDRFNPDLVSLVDEAAKVNLDLTIGGTDLVRNLQHAFEGRDIWTMNWMLRSMLDSGVFLYPVESQVRNVGMDGTGLHCGATDRFDVRPPTRTPDRLPDEIFIDPDLAATFYSYYDLKGTQRDPNLDHIGPHPVKRLLVNGDDGKRRNGHNGISKPVNGTAAVKLTRADDPVPSTVPVVQAGSDEDLIVFVSDEPRSREAKLAHGLKAAGKRVVLLHKRTPSFDPSRFFIETRAYTTPAEAVQLAKEYHPFVYHAFSNWNFETSEALIREKPGTVLFDDYDVMTGMLREDVIAWKHPGKPEQERFCIENADGLVARHLELRYLRHELGFKLPPRLLALDACWADRSSESISKLSEETGKVHVVTCGNYNPDDPSVEGDVVYVYEVARILHEAGMEYHIYPSTQKLGDTTRRGMQAQGLGGALGHTVHVHNPLPPDDLIPTLARYDYGLHILSQRIRGVRHRYELRKYEHATANKIFDFIDAGLHILVHGGRFQRFLSTRYGHGRQLHSLDELQGLPVPPQSPPIPAAYRVEIVAHRLLEFYERVATERLQIVEEVVG